MRAMRSAAVSALALREFEGGLEVGAQEITRGGEDDLEVLGGAFGEASGFGHAETAHQNRAIVKERFKVAAAEAGKLFGDRSGVVGGRFEPSDEEAADEVDDGEVKVLFVLEVGVERALGSFRACSDQVHGGAFEACVEKDILESSNDCSNNADRADWIRGS
jgi:hypothetical protein